MGRPKSIIPEFKISDFSNPRSISKQVRGTLPSGKRIKKNFSGPNAQLLAQSYINSLTAVHTLAPARLVSTRLSDVAVAQAEAMVTMLPEGVNLIDVARFYADNHKPLRALPMVEAIGAYCDWLGTQRKNEEATVEQRRDVLLHFAKHRAKDRRGLPLGPIENSDGMSIEHAESWVYDPARAARTQRDRYDLLCRFCRFLEKRQHAPRNVTKDLERPFVKISAPGVLSFDQVWTLLMTALTDAEGPEMLPFFAISVLSGVRPAEIPRLSRGEFFPDGTPNPWAAVHLAPEHRIIEVNLAKGGRSRRQVEICDPLVRILTWCKEQGLAPNYFSDRKFDRIRRNAGVFDLWEKDLLRHTYASHHFIFYKDVPGLVANMGNSERVLFQNYIRPVSRADAEALFGLTLHWGAPRAKSLIRARMDVYVERDPQTLDLDLLRAVRTRLAGEAAKVRRRPRGDHDKELRVLEAQLGRVRLELARRGVS